MLQHFKRNIFSILYVLVLTTIIFFVFNRLIPKSENLMEDSAAQVTSDMKETLELVAIGDSLTQGVGDTTDSGGFVPLIAKKLQASYSLQTVETANYGVSGNRSDQILKRIKNDEEIRSSLESADVITLTVGGNDLMKVIKSELFHDLTVDSFEEPLKEYQKGLEELFSEIRALNASAPIYLFGIYNPFYVYFSEIEEMQTIVSNWNDGTESVVEAQENSHFIPINDLLYSGLNGESGITSDSETNELIYDYDHFHPNNLGYQMMANALYDRMNETQYEWLSTTSKGGE